MVQYIFSNQHLDSDDVSIVGEFTGNVPVKLTQRGPFNINGYVVNFETDGIYPFKYIVDGVEKIVMNKVQMKNSDGSYSNFVEIQSGMLNNDYLAYSIKLNDTETIANAFYNMCPVLESIYNKDYSTVNKNIAHLLMSTRRAFNPVSSNKTNDLYINEDLKKHANLLNDSRDNVIEKMNILTKNCLNSKNALEAMKHICDNLKSSIHTLVDSDEVLEAQSYIQMIETYLEEQNGEIGSILEKNTDAANETITKINSLTDDIKSFMTIGDVSEPVATSAPVSTPVAAPVPVVEPAPAPVVEPAPAPAVSKPSVAEIVDKQIVELIEQASSNPSYYLMAANLCMNYFMNTPIKTMKLGDYCSVALQCFTKYAEILKIETNPELIPEEDYAILNTFTNEYTKFYMISVYAISGKNDDALVGYPCLLICGKVKEFIASKNSEYLQDLIDYYNRFGITPDDSEICLKNCIKAADSGHSKAKHLLSEYYLKMASRFKNE